MAIPTRRVNTPLDALRSQFRVLHQFALEARGDRVVKLLPAGKRLRLLEVYAQGLELILCTGHIRII